MLVPMRMSEIRLGRVILYASPYTFALSLNHEIAKMPFNNSPMKYPLVDLKRLLFEVDSDFYTLSRQGISPQNGVKDSISLYNRRTNVYEKLFR